MRVKVIETVEYELDASDGRSAELIVAMQTHHHGRGCFTRPGMTYRVKARHVIEQPEGAAVLQLRREQFGGAL